MKFPFGFRPILRDELLVSGSVTNQQTSHVLLFSSIEVVERIYFLVSV